VKYVKYEALLKNKSMKAQDLILPADININKANQSGQTVTIALTVRFFCNALIDRMVS